MLRIPLFIKKNKLKCIMMKKILIICFISICSLPIIAQIQGNSAAIPETTTTSEAFSVIKIKTTFTKDSTGYSIQCVNVAGKDAILIKSNKYKGLTLDFHRSMSKSMFKQALESTETEISIKTIFAGTFYLDVLNENGIKIKTFIIEKSF